MPDINNFRLFVKDLLDILSAKSVTHFAKLPKLPFSFVGRLKEATLIIMKASCARTNFGIGRQVYSEDDCLLVIVHPDKFWGSGLAEGATP